MILVGFLGWLTPGLWLESARELPNTKRAFFGNSIRDGSRGHARHGSGGSRQERLRHALVVPESRLREEIGLLDPARDLAALALLLRRLASQDPLAALEALDALNVPRDQTFKGSSQIEHFSPYDHLMSAILGTWAEKAPGETLAWIRENLKPPTNLMPDTVASLAAFDAPSTAEVVIAVSREARLGSLLQPVFTELLDKAGSAAACGALAESLASRSPNSGILESLFVEWQRKSPVDAVAWAEKLPDSIVQADDTGALGSLVGRVSPGSGIILGLRTLADKLDTEALRDKFLAVSTQGPERISRGSSVDFAVQGLVENYRQWVAQDPAAAARWIATDPDSPVLQALATQTPLALVTTNPEGAAASLNALPTHSRHDVVKNLARITAAQGVESVNGLASRISDPVTRDVYLGTAINRFALQGGTDAASLLPLVSDPGLRQRLSEDMAEVTQDGAPK